MRIAGSLPTAAAAPSQARQQRSGCSMRLGVLISATPSTSGRGAPPARARRTPTRAAAAAGGGGEPPLGNWWDKLNKRDLTAPVQLRPPPERVQDTWEGWGEARMGRASFQQMESLRQQERQRVWDNMRTLARARYEAGIMPAWFNPEWLDWEEAPVNAWWRSQGLSMYQTDDTWLGGDGGCDGGGGGGSGGGGGGGWWRPDDPYWPMRDWGDHPMRWWTWAWAAVLAAGGMATAAARGSGESAFVGLGAAAALAVAAGAMSDMKCRSYGAAGVKAAWVVCALLAAKEWGWGWAHRPREAEQPRQLGACGWAALSMCVLYMWTGMAGLDDGTALPMNPGGAFKLEDVAQKSKVWKAWGYEQFTMR